MIVEIVVGVLLVFVLLVVGMRRRPKNFPPGIISIRFYR